MKQFLTLAIILYTVSGSFSQMAGTYTVGGTNPDFLTPIEAINAINTQGTSDTVILNIRDGIYVDDYSWNVGMQTNYLIVVQSESLDSSAVTIQSIPGEYVNFNGSANVSFRYLTFGSGTYSFQAENSSKITLEYCSFYGGTAYSIRMGGGGKKQIRNCFCDNKINVWLGNYSVFENNHILGRVYFYGGGNVKIRENIFEDIVSSLPSSSEIYNNAFNNYCNTSHDSYIDFHHNTFLYDLDLSFGDYHKIRANIIYGDLDISFGTSPFVSNNHLHGNVSITPDDEVQFYYNNVIGNFTTTYSYSSNYRNNNFSGYVNFYFGAPDSVQNVSNNNYFPGIGAHGYDMTHIDPMYVFPDTLIATNPLLIGKGTDITSVQMDMDSIVRPLYFTTIGANEILCFDNDTVYLNCNDELQLKLCSMQNASGIILTPNIYVTDSSGVFPFVKPPTNTTYTLLDTLNGITDSVTIIVDPFNLIMAPDQYTYCGTDVIIHQVYYNQDSITHIWDPDTNVWQYGNFWMANPTNTTTYVLTLDHSSCGIFMDSVTIYVDSLPFASYYVDSLIDSTMYFHNTSNCYDYVKWYFGDGDSSSVIDPVHTYSPGTYWPMLIACNIYGCDTVKHGYFIPPPPDTSTASLEPIPEDTYVNLYPNPNSGTFNIEIKGLYGDVQLSIYDLQGKLVFEEKLDEAVEIKKSYSFQWMEKGFYMVVLESELIKETKRLIIE